MKRLYEWLMRWINQDTVRFCNELHNDVDTSEIFVIGVYNGKHQRIKVTTRWYNETKGNLS